MPPKKANGYKMPAPLPEGLVLQDVVKKQWILGPSIGKGGFGEIYSAKSASSNEKTYPYVVKIEPHANGPLFVEMHFYSKNCKPDDLSAYKLGKKWGKLGIPEFLGSGSHEHKGEKYRFIVIERFGDELHKLYLANNKSLPVGTVYKIALQMVNVLEFIHSKGYVHADLKGANILFSIKDRNSAYLVDFGMTGKYSTESTFKPDPKKMHNGTIEYLSRDAHCGVLTRRGDLEILAFNILHWLGGKLPWDTKLTNPKTVQSLKESNMKDIPNFLKNCLPAEISGKIPKEFLTYINDLNFNEEPDYEYVRKLFKTALKEVKCTEKSPLVFTNDSSSTKRKSESEATIKTAKKPKKNEDLTGSKTGGKVSKENGSPKKVPKVPAKRTRRVATITATAPEPDTSNGVILNREMQRLKERLEQKTVKSPSRRPKKLNKSLDDIVDDEMVDSEEEPIAPIARPLRSRRK